MIPFIGEDENDEGDETQKEKGEAPLEKAPLKMRMRALFGDLDRQSRTHYNGWLRHLKKRSIVQEEKIKSFIAEKM